MSGVFGYWHLDGRPGSRALVARCLERVSPQGLTDIESWIEGPVALGRKSSINPDPIGCARVACTLDGRIDNRAELLNALSGKWPLVTDCPDSVLVRTAYLEYGTS